MRWLRQTAVRDAALPALVKPRPAHAPVESAAALVGTHCAAAPRLSATLLPSSVAPPKTTDAAALEEGAFSTAMLLTKPPSALLAMIMGPAAEPAAAAALPTASHAPAAMFQRATFVVLATAAPPTVFATLAKRPPA